MSKPSTSAPRSHRRWRLLADTKIQGELLLRLVVYWMIFQLIPFGTQAAFNAISSNAAVSLMPAFYISLLILPILLLDALKFSNRFAGPVVNLRNTLNRVDGGDTSARVKFRPMDYYTDLETPINTLIACAVETNTQIASAVPPPAHSPERLPSLVISEAGGHCDYQTKTH